MEQVWIGRELMPPNQLLPGQSSGSTDSCPRARGSSIAFTQPEPPRLWQPPWLPRC